MTLCCSVTDCLNFLNIFYCKYVNILVNLFMATTKGPNILICEV